MMVVRSLRVALAVAWLLASAAGATRATEDGRIVVVRAATVGGKTVRLADVARLEGRGWDFAELELGPAPDPGTTRRLDGLGILRRLREAGLDEDATRYQIPASVRVARAAQTVSVEEVRGRIAREVVALLGPSESLRALEVPAAIQIPVGDYEARVAPPAALARGTRRRFDVELVQDADVVSRFPVRAEVSAYGPVLMVRHPIAPGTVLRAGDLVVEERELAGVPAGTVTAAAQAVGKEARVALVPATPLSFHQLATPLLVRRGDIVTVVVETPGMRLSVPGEALEAGGAAAAIRVRNRKSQQELVGQVMERGIVLVQY